MKVNMDNDILSVVSTVMLCLILIIIIFATFYLEEINKKMDNLTNNCIKIENKTYCERGN